MKSKANISSFSISIPKKQIHETYIYILSLLFLYTSIESGSPVDEHSFDEYFLNASDENGVSFEPQCFAKAIIKFRHGDSYKEALRKNKDGKKYRLNQEDYELASRLQNFISYYSYLKSGWVSSNLGKQTLLTFIKDPSNHIEQIMAILAYEDHLLQPDHKESMYLINTYLYFSNHSKIISQIDLLKPTILDEYKTCPISIIIKDRWVLESLLHLGYDLLNSIPTIDSELLGCMSFLNPEALFERLTSFQKGISIQFHSIITAFISSLDDKRKTVFNKRFAIYPYEKEATLEEIGSEFGLTRERVRQIESVLIRDWNRLPCISIYGQLMTDLLFGNCSYLPEEALAEKLNDSLIESILKQKDLNIITHISYDKLGFFYINQEISKEAVVEQELVGIPDYLTESAVSTLPLLKQKIIRGTYSLRKSGLLCRANISPKKHVLDFIVDHFPNGFKPYSEQDYATFVKLFSETYGAEVDVPTSASIRGLVGQYTDLFYESDIGTIKPRCYCNIEIPDELVAKISKYVLDNGPTVQYGTIFSVFQPELSELGIQNRFLLKGLLDYKLDHSVFHTMRDYVQLKDNQKPLTTVFKDYMDSQTGLFTIQELNQKFPGVKNYCFTNLLYMDSTYMFLGNGEYLNLKNSGATPDILNLIKEEINNYFNRTQEEILSSRKLFANLRLFHKEIFNQMPDIRFQSHLYALCKSAFKNDFYFKRPFIYKSKVAMLSGEAMINAYIETLDSFSHESIRNYCQKFNINPKCKFMDRLTDFSDTYVQYNRDSAVKKTKINIPDYILKDIEITLSDILSDKNELDLGKFSGYPLLPKIPGYSWNEYLLAGILMSYFQDIFSVRTTGNNIRLDYDYVVTKNKGATL